MQTWSIFLKYVAINKYLKALSRKFRVILNIDHISFTT